MKSSKILFCDMDGTLARFYEPAGCLEKYKTDPDYFAKLRPYDSLVKAIAMLMADGVPVVILSAVDGEIRESVEAQKNEWLKKVFGEYGSVPQALYPQSGTSKSAYVRNAMCGPENSVLLDDYSKNLMEWEGESVKALNEINGSGGKFQGPRINIDTDSPEVIYTALKSILAS